MEEEIFTDSTKNTFQTKSKLQTHPLIKESILNGKDFHSDPYTYVNTVTNATEEHLIFVVHGIGQDTRKLQSTLQKIKLSINHMYENKSNLLKKQIHVRMIDWKTLLLENEKDLLDNLVDSNNNTKYPKMFIQQTPVDVLQYLSSRNKNHIINDVINQMNIYYNCVKKYRPLFKGNVSLAGHSLGSVMMYEILTNMTKKVGEDKKFENNDDFPNENEKHFDKLETNTILKIDRKKRKDNLKSIIGEKQLKISDHILLEIDINVENNQKSRQKDCSRYSITENELESNSYLNEDYFSNNFKVYSKNPEINPLDFTIDHFFLLGSPLSLFLTIEHGKNSFLQEMEIVKDFHNIIHPMDPVAYRIEPIIKNYPNTKHSFTLPHWENDGIKNIVLYKLKNFFCCEKGEEYYINHDKDINRKRYDFMVQESISEKAVTMIGFLFSHMAYWNNPDVFYFIIKMIHWQGYTHINHTSRYKHKSGI